MEDTTPTGTPEIESEFKHDESGEHVVVVEHMFDVPPESMNGISPFIIERSSDGERIGFEDAELFYDEYTAVEDL